MKRITKKQQKIILHVSTFYILCRFFASSIYSPGSSTKILSRAKLSKISVYFGVVRRGENSKK